MFFFGFLLFLVLARNVIFDLDHIVACFRAWEWDAKGAIVTEERIWLTNLITTRLVRSSFFPCIPRRFCR